MKLRLLGAPLALVLVAAAMSAQGPPANLTSNLTNISSLTNTSNSTNISQYLTAQRLETLFDLNKRYNQSWSPFQVNTTNNNSLPNVTIPSWDPEADVSGSMDLDEPIANPLNDAPAPFPVHNMAMTLKNFDKDLMQILFMRAERFNNTLNDTELFSLNNRIYAFTWRNGSFERAPFPVNSTYPFREVTGNDTDRPIVLTPLKNRFAARPINKKQMQCALHMRILEANHYVGKFNRIILQFFSPCMEFPVLRYLINKAGLRAHLRLNMLGHLYNFQFRRSYLTQLGASKTEAYRQYRYLRPHHHRAHFVGRKYKVDNRTHFTAVLNNRTVTPKQMFAMQATIIDMLDKEYDKRENLLHEQDQTREWRSRHEVFPRKAKSDSDQKGKPTKSQKQSKNATKKTNRKTKKTDDGLKGHHEHLSRSPKDFKFSKQQADRNLKIATDMMGGQRNLQQMFQSISANSPWAVLPKTPAQLYRNSNTNQTLYRRQEDATASYRRNHYGVGLGTLENQVIPLITQIRQNEPYRIHTCQRICTTQAYYHSWNFCLRVCGINYNFLSNLQDPFAKVDLFPTVAWQRVAASLTALPRPKRKGEQFTFDEIKAFWDKPQVYACRQSWSRFRCSL